VAALKELADSGLTAGCVLANLHHRRVIPLMERRLRIFEMSEDADPIALAESRLLREPFPRLYAATRARRAIDLRSGRCDDASLWALEMLPVGQLVSGFLDLPSCFVGFSGCRCVLMLRPTPAGDARERREVRSTHASGSASGRDSLHLGRRSTHHRTRKRRKRRKKSGSRFSPIGGSLHPRHRSRLR
jgi:hypothetical protein